MAAGEVRAGTAVVDITPDPTREKLPLHGYGARRGRPLEGVHDPLHAKILVLEQDGRRAAIAALDILQIDIEFVRMVVARAGVPGLDETTVVLTASHTHSAPVGIEPRSKNNVRPLRFYDEGYCERIATAIAGGLRTAAAATKPIRLAHGSAEVPGMVRNRRVAAYDYGLRTFAGPEAPVEVIDRELGVVHLVGADESPVATLVNLAAHATVLGSRNMLVSADWPGSMQRAVEAKLGGVCLYTNGAQGNVAPGTGDKEADFDDAERYGQSAAARVIEVVGAFTPDAPGALTMTSAVIELPPVTIQTENPFLKLGLIKRAAEGIVGRYYPKATRMSALRLGDVGLAAIPGEMFTELGLELKRRARAAGVPHPLVLGLANDAVGYIPPRDQFGTTGGYEVSMCFYGPALGELLVDRAVTQLASLYPGVKAA
jgi:hypothetical protein